MKIQLITYDSKNNPYGILISEVNSFATARVFDDFDINIIDLTDASIWRNKDNSCQSVDSKNDFKSLGVLLKNSQNKSRVIIILPGNNLFYYYKRSGGGYYSTKALKDMIGELQNQILSDICNISGKFVSGATSTAIDGIIIRSDFYFSDVREWDIVTQTENGFATSVCNENKTVVSTFLKLDSANKLQAFIKAAGLAPSKKEAAPEWIENLDMFDDIEQNKIIAKSEAIIADQKEVIKKANSQLEQNSRWKSILYTQGDELVNVVFEMFEVLLGIDLSGFEDENKEDFNYQYGDTTIIGEIKGVSSGVKNAHVSQLVNNVSIYKDEHPEDTNEIVSLLVINPQRKIAPQEREVVQEAQINLAKRNDVLIIETAAFLSLFEKYVNGELSREECWKMISTETGLFMQERE